ncbi:MAG: DUF4405 domain-containing protein, partial [bacterium]|nr:DUF4405 domain-containing protein [bacterium]
MNMRRVASLTALLTFVFLFVSSVVLYFIPFGRWTLNYYFGLSSRHWIHLHTNVGILFLLAVFLHIYYNWKPIKNYLKNRSKKMIVFTKEFTLSLVLLLVFALGTYYGLPPFGWLDDGNESIKKAGRSYRDLTAAEAQGKEGESVSTGRGSMGRAAKGGPLAGKSGAGVGRLTIEQFCSTYQLDVSRVKKILADRGLEVEDGATILNIARANNLTPYD